MKLTQANLDQHGALYAVLPNGQLVGIEPCESEDDIELPLYENLGTQQNPEWEVLDSQFYKNSPYVNLEDVIEDNPIFKQYNWISINDIKFH